MERKTVVSPDKGLYEEWMSLGNSLYAAGDTKGAEAAWSIAETYRPLTQAPPKL